MRKSQKMRANLISHGSFMIVAKAVNQPTGVCSALIQTRSVQSIPLTGM